MPQGRAEGSTPELVIRVARPEDAPAVADIYNQGIRGRLATYETQERTASDILGWFTDGATHPFLVAAEADGAVVGWIRASMYRPRAVYRTNAEYSVYVRGDRQGRRVGDALMAAFLAACRDAGLTKLVSRIFPENHSSRALCARHGFREVGTYRRHARLDGVWRDVVIVERLLEDDLD